MFGNRGQRTPIIRESIQWYGFLYQTIFTRQNFYEDEVIGEDARRRKPPEGMVDLVVAYFTIFTILGTNVLRSSYASLILFLFFYGFAFLGGIIAIHSIKMIYSIRQANNYIKRVLITALVVCFILGIFSIAFSSMNSANNSDNCYEIITNPDQNPNKLYVETNSVNCSNISDPGFKSFRSEIILALFFNGILLSIYGVLIFAELNIDQIEHAWEINYQIFLDPIQAFPYILYIVMIVATICTFFGIPYI